MKKCFLCGKKTPKILDFKGELIYNCYMKLLFRKEKGFKYNDILFTKESIEKLGYHSKCYQKVTVLHHKYNEAYLSFVKNYGEPDLNRCGTDDSYPEDSKEDLIPLHENENSLTGTDNTFQHNADNSYVEDVKYLTTHIDIPSVSPEFQRVITPSISNYAQPSYDTLEIDERPKLENREDDLDSFGKYVTSSLRTLSANNCIHAQDEIQSILSKYKIRNINKRRNSTRRKPESCSSDSDEQ